MTRTPDAPPFPPEPPTQLECPARGCVAGEVTTRAEDGFGGYRVARIACAYCAGTGTVTPERHAAWRKLEKLTAK
jgi:hypothetical protein